MPQCEFRKQDGKRCRANALRDAALCISHNPAAADVKRAAVRKGGRNRRTRRRAPKVAAALSIRTIDDVKHLLFRTLEELRKGALDADVARSIGYLAGVATKVGETVELARRGADIEAAASAG